MADYKNMLIILRLEFGMSKLLKICPLISNSMPYLTARPTGEAGQTGLSCNAKMLVINGIIL